MSLPAIPRPTMLAAACAATGVVIAATALAADVLGNAVPIAPLAASVGLAISTPHAPAAQPRSIVGGHALCIACGVLAAALLGHGTPALVIAGVLAVAVTLGARVPQPPAVAMALVVAGGAFAAGDLLLLVALSGLVAVAMVLVHRLRRTPYPLYW